MQLLESPIPPLTAAALRMIICKRPAPHFDNHEKGMKNVFLRPLTMRWNVLWVPKNQITMQTNEKMLTHFSSQGLGSWP